MQEKRNVSLADSGPSIRQKCPNRKNGRTDAGSQYTRLSANVHEHLLCATFCYRNGTAELSQKPEHMPPSGHSLAV